MNQKHITTFRLLTRLCAILAMGLSLIGCLTIFLSNPKAEATSYLLPGAMALAVVVYGLVLAIKTNQSPKTLAGFSLSYQVIAIGLGFVAWTFGFVYAVLGGLTSGGGGLSSSSLPVSSQVASSASSGALSPGVSQAIGVFFSLYTVSAVLFLLLGVTKTAFSFLFLKDHKKWNKAYIALALATAFTMLVSLIALSAESVLIDSVKTTSVPTVLVPSMLGSSFFLLFLAQDLAWYSGPEMNLSFENGLTPKEQ